jgi:hypothetical protein
MRTTLPVVATLGSLSLLALAPACHHHGERRGERHVGDHDHDHDESHDEASTPLLGAKGEARSAARNIAGARCDREAKCNNIGPDKKYASDDACEDQIRADWANDLNAYDCPGGVVDKELEECLNAIRNEDCNSPFDTLSRVSECMASQICAD